MAQLLSASKSAPELSALNTTRITVDPMQGKNKSKIDRKPTKIGHRRATQNGVVTYRKIETTQIMGSIQLGLEHSIAGLASKPERDLLSKDFMTVEQAYFPSCGSKETPAHRFSDFRFETYAPMAFRYFRDLFNIFPADFLMSMCSMPMRELSNPGASGSIFYVTHDDKFIVKTVEAKECEFLQRLLPGYYMNLQQNSGTLLPRFYGLFCYHCNAKNIRLVIMNNLLPSSIQIHQKYDVKGSTYKRKASKAEKAKASPTYKDLDFMDHYDSGIQLDPEIWQSLLKTMERDTRVLESFEIMDYSLLVAIHKLNVRESQGQQDDNVSDSGSNMGLPASRLSLLRSSHSASVATGILGRNSKGEPLILFLGIIDILQSYGMRKKMEHAFKAMLHDGDTVSVHRPGFYAERFMKFAHHVFKKKTNPTKQPVPTKKKQSTRTRIIQKQLAGSANLPQVVVENAPPNPSHLLSEPMTSTYLTSALSDPSLVSHSKYSLGIKDKQSKNDSGNSDKNRLSVGSGEIEYKSRRRVTFQF